MTETEKEIYKCYKYLAFAIINQAKKDIKSHACNRLDKESAVDFITG